MSSPDSLEQFAQRSDAFACLIYGAAAVTGSGFLIILRIQPGQEVWRAFLVWLVGCGIPLFFVYGYARFVCRERAQAKIARFWFVTAGPVAMIIALPLVLKPFSNIARNDAWTIPLLLSLLATLAVLLPSGLALAIRGRSSLVQAGAILVWPYWLFLSLTQLARYSQPTAPDCIVGALFCVTPVLLAFSAGAVSTNAERVAHATALCAVLGLPWIYENIIRGNGFDNVWLLFNVPERELGGYAWPYANLAILCVASMVMAIVTAALRLLPVGWKWRKRPIGERTWPAVVASILILAIWYSKSVMPYRIPGAVDYSYWPDVQILHVEKHGLQFHEKCVSVSGLKWNALRVSFAENNRRWFQYRFEERNSSATLSATVAADVLGKARSLERTTANWEPIRPVRSWNADNWYFYTQGGAFESFTTENGRKPPEEVVALFQELEGLPRSGERAMQMKEVCLGFCYEPLSAMGRLYSNHRCFNDGKKTVCR